MSNAAMALREQHSAVKGMLVKAEGRIGALLPPTMSAKRFVIVASNLLARTPSLLRCTPVSLVESIVTGAELGLEFAPALGQAYLVPFWDKRTRATKAQLIPGYRGYVTLALESPRYGAIDADVIREGDEYSWERGTTPKLYHRPVIGGVGKVIAAYAVVHHADPSVPPRVAMVDAGELDAIKVESLAKIKQDWQRAIAPWTKHEGEMQRKTAVRRLAKMLVLTAKLERALTLDDEYERRQRLGGANTEALKARLQAEQGKTSPVDEALEEIDEEAVADALEAEAEPVP